MTATPTCKEAAYGTHREREEFEGSDKKILIITHLALAIMRLKPYMVPEGQQGRSGGLRPENFRSCIPYNARIRPCTNIITLALENFKL